MGLRAGGEGKGDEEGIGDLKDSDGGVKEDKGAFDPGVEEENGGVLEFTIVLLGRFAIVL